jgi:putative salt-induced outer membrane protein YdiY
MDLFNFKRGVSSTPVPARRVFRQASLILWIMAVGALPIRAQRRDVVVMKNGDQLTGKIRKLQRGQLYIETPYSVDPIPVDWSQVDRLESTAMYQIELDGGKRLVGTIEKNPTADASEGDFRLVGGGSEISLMASHVVGIQSQKENFWRQLKGSVDFGFGYASGSGQTQANIDASATYPSTKFQVGTTFNSAFTNTGQTGRTNRIEGESTSQIYLSRRAFIGTQVDLLTSTQQSLILRTTFGGGYGRYLIRSNRKNLFWLAGVVGTRESYNPSSGLNPRQNNVEGLVTVVYDWFQFSKAELQTSLNVYPSFSDPGRVRSDLNTSFSFKFAHDLYLRFSLWDTFDSQPPVNARKNELGVSNAFGWSF